MALEEDEERRAQSRGEWPGVRSTLRLGLLGMDVCVGGGARENEEEEEEGWGRRLGSGEREGGGIRVDAGTTGLRRGGARAPPDARWAELRAGNEGAGGESSSLKAGMEDVEVAVDVAVARGVVGDDGEDGFLSDGGGGGGMAFLS